MNEYSVSMSSIQKTFGKRMVLKDVSFDIAPGEVVGLVGLNGAGKTTLIRVILGLLESDYGSCSVLGRNPLKAKGDFFNRLGVVLEHNGFDGNLTVMDNLLFYARAKGISRQTMDTYFSRWWAESAIDNPSKRIKYFSRGQKMMCALCRAFMGWPDVYFFDEPVVALDVSAYRKFCALVREAKNMGAAMIISSHQLDAIDDLCDSVVILEGGKLKPLRRDGANRDMDEWLIRAKGNIELLKEKVNSFREADASFEGDYIKCIVARKDEDVIPEMVSSLVNSGCRIYEVYRAGLKESIKQYYSQEKKRSGR